MRKYTGITGLLLLLTLWMPQAVHPQSAEPVEILTYRLFTEQKWDSLLFVGEAAIASGTDYFYLRMRTGRAAIELHRYAKAANHLEKAREFNELDTDAATLLYLAYLYEGRTATARYMCGELPPKMQETMCTDGFSLRLMAEAGYLTSNQNDRYPRYGRNQSLIYTEDHTYRIAEYGLVGAEQQLGYRLGLSGAVSALSFDKQRNVTIGGRDTLFGKYRISQIEFYLSPAITLNKHFVFEPAFKWIVVSFPQPFVSYDPVSGGYFILELKSNFHDYVAGAQLTYTAPYFNLYAGAWAAQYGGSKVKQTSLGLMTRPFGNLNLYTNTVVSLTYSRNRSNFLLSQKAGFRVSDWLWAELFASFGDHSGASEYNGRVFYNLFDHINSYAGGKLIVPLNTNLRLSLHYQWYNCEGNSFKILPDGKEIVSKYKYQNQMITGGLVWKIN